MFSGFTGYIDTAQIVLYLFWIFFAGLVYYLHRESKREGYPLESDRSAHITVEGFPSMPEPKVYRLMHGGTHEVPRAEPPEGDLAAQPVGPWPGAPLEPTGDAMADGVGPAAYAQRADTPDLTLEGELKIVPMRVAADFSVEPRCPDPRGMTVVGGDGAEGGRVVDIWVDRSEPQIRYLEVESKGAGRRTLVPMALAKVGGDGAVQVRSITGAQFDSAPSTRDPDKVTLLEEDKISAYFGGGTLYALPERFGPWL